VQAASVADFAVRDMNQYHESVRLVGLGNRHALDLKDARTTEVIFNDMPFSHPIPRPSAARACTPTCWGAAFLDAVALNMLL
jgi:hypothetical protein